jgi:hypothetical protein
VWDTLAIFALSSLLSSSPAPETVRPDPDFFTRLDLPARATLPAAPYPWATPAGLSPAVRTLPEFGPADAFQHLLDHHEPDDHPRPATLAGVIVASGRRRYQVETTSGVFRRRTRWELADPNEMLLPHSGQTWSAQERLQIPVPIPLPVAEQMFVYSQFEGSGDPLNPRQTFLFGKTGVGLKWSPAAGSELQLRYATLLSYGDDAELGRFQERAQPAVEVMARLPLFGPLEIEYTGSAIPAVAATDLDQLRQELRLAIPLAGDNELEFGARYRWEWNPAPTPWTDRATLFLGVRFRH